jgi:hypothetical protein
MTIHALSDSEWLYEIVNLATATSQTILATKAVLGKVTVHTALSAHAVSVDDGATAILNIPASATLNTLYSGLEGTIVDSLKVTSNASSTGKLVVQYRVAK